MSARDVAAAQFRDRFGGNPEFVVRAPGRVNLIGEHTDYNDGFVLPMAIDRAVWIALRTRDDRMVRIVSSGHPEAEFDLDDLVQGIDGWAEYVKGVAWSTGSAGLSGWDGAVASDIPIGAGLSSSAALEIATALVFATVSGDEWDPIASALVAQRAENEWVGVSCGIMDQLIVATASEGHATLIDCRTLELAPVPLPDDATIVILDTGTRRQLVDSEYDERRRACERAAEAAAVPALRDLTSADLDVLTSLVDDITLRRARHVVTENDRTIEAATALRAGDTTRFGQLMDASHRSLRDDFQVSSEALDLMVEIASGVDGCLGARMTGAGFGGCAVALVASSAPATFVDKVVERYASVTGLEPKAYVTGAASGASVDPIVYG
ncbi:MAG: galactokinase [Actinomycetota bacterium]|nr:galactokinase [Actinomycetota bacterium]